MWYAISDTCISHLDPPTDRRKRCWGSDALSTIASGDRKMPAWKMVGHDKWPAVEQAVQRLP